MRVTLNRTYAGFTDKAFFNPAHKAWIPREFTLNWEDNTKPPSAIVCDLPVWFMEKHSIKPTIDELNSEFKGKRITIIDGDGEKFGGVVNYFTTNHFPEHGKLCYFGRRPVYNIRPLSIKLIPKPLTVRS